MRLQNTFCKVRKVRGPGEGGHSVVVFLLFYFTEGVAVSVKWMCMCMRFMFSIFHIFRGPLRFRPVVYARRIGGETLESQYFVGECACV